MTDDTSGVYATEPLSIEENDAESNDDNNFKSFDTKVSDEETGKEQERPVHATFAAPRTRYRDHYSLAYPSSTVRFRSSGKSYRVYEGNRSQYVLEEEHSGEITVKRVTDRTNGVMFLRAVSTVVTLLWSGFLFVFCTQILIFLVMDLVVYLGGTTGSDVAVGRAIGSFLSFPLFIHGLSQALIIAGHFIADTWASHYLIKTLVFRTRNSVLAAWTTFCFFLGFPLFCMGVSLLSGRPDWWSITALFWFSSVSVFYVIFALVIIYYEIKACLEMVANEYNIQNDDKLELIKKCILLRQVNTLSGKKSRVYMARGTLHNVDSIRTTVTEKELRYYPYFYSRFTEWPFLQRIGMIEPVLAPKLTYPVEEALGVRPFVTRTTWSLEKLYFKPSNSWYVAVIKGPAALTPAQIKSSFICSLIGNLLVWFLVASLLVWFDIGGAIVAVVVLAIAILSVPSFRTTLQIFNMAKDVIRLESTDIIEADDQEEGNSEDASMHTAKESEDTGSLGSTPEFGLTGVQDSEGIFQICESYRITVASNRYCWIMFVLQIALLYLWPLVALYVVNDTAIGTVFLFVGLVSLFRYFLNAAVILEEVGDFRGLSGKDEYGKWKNQSRTSDIVANITRSRSRWAWTIVLGFFLVITMVLGVGALTGDTSQTTGGYNITLVSGFSYSREENSLPYPSCNLDFNADVPSGGIIATRDFAFLSAMAYEGNSTVVQEQLDTWFGSNFSYDMPGVVDQFRNETNRELSIVTYKLYSFPNVSSTLGAPFAVVGIRGSQNSWDWLTNAQLWSAPFGMQILRSFLPFGLFWNPILDELVKAISIIESRSITSVSYYVETTDFVEWLRASGEYADIKLTGHSLGGGLSIISAAQTGVSGVAISGPNAMMLRKSLKPPISRESLDTYTFNVIPARDFVPRAGGVAKLYENIECTAPANEFSSCHDIVRSLCELLFTCGTEGRPVLCQCVSEFGYPEPQSLNGESFVEVCGP